MGDHCALAARPRQPRRGAADHGPRRVDAAHGAAHAARAALLARARNAAAAGRWRASEHPVAPRALGGGRDCRGAVWQPGPEPPRHRQRPAFAERRRVPPNLLLLLLLILLRVLPEPASATSLLRWSSGVCFALPSCFMTHFRTWSSPMICSLRCRADVVLRGCLGTLTAASSWHCAAAFISGILHARPSTRRTEYSS